MNEWLLDLPVLWMTVVIVGATWAFAAGVYALVTALATGARADAFKAISPGMLPPLAVVFGLLVAFLAAQVWGDAEHASAAVNREAGALRATVLLAAAFPGDTETAIRDEWPAMASGPPA